MSTRPLPAPSVLADDPGPWSVVSSVFALPGRPGRRRPQPPMGLMMSPAPSTPLALAGIDPASRVAGIGPLRVVAASREPAFVLTFDEGVGVFRGVSPFVVRAWSLPSLALHSEERPGDDPAAELPPPVHPESLHEKDVPALAVSPGGEYVAVHSREGRSDVVAFIRISDGGLARWVRGARAAAWSADGRHLALGGPWGVLLATTRDDAS